MAIPKAGGNRLKPFANASQAFKLANPNLLVDHLRGLRCGMNKTESEFALRLEAQKRSGEILRYEFEGVTLRFANVKYTPDFVVFGHVGDVESGFFGDPFVKFIEVKGPFIKGNRERAVERFRHAKSYWPEFTFEMWQKKDGSWNQII